MIDFRNIKYLVLDLDGTLTDGCYAVSENGTISKSFYSKDFYAIEQAQTAGLVCIILTHAQDLVIDAKVDQLPGVCRTNLWIKKVKIPRPKEEALEAFITGLTRGRLPIDWSQVAYIGDNDNDLGCIEKSAWTACPADGSTIIKKNVNVITDAVGGKGAVYEFVMDILDRRKQS
ncbi:MAG: hypothetical protein HC888_00285 [Candidatus Competibacteraceae bacterium]|nr:hypothetical protein [Candidatus Competibacteraceae bacterium]